MNVNKYKPHVWVIPEDDADRQLVSGFLLHAAVADRVVSVRAPAGGWRKACEVFECEYLPLLRSFPLGHAVLVIDFDEAIDRGPTIQSNIPDDVKSRVFVLGSKDEPEALKQEFNMSLENIGHALAEDCFSGELTKWSHPQLIHNSVEVRRLVEFVKPILFCK